LVASTPIAALPGVGPSRARQLAALGLQTASDLRWHLPNRYVFYPPPRPASHIGFEEVASFEGTVTQLSEAFLPGNRRRITAVLKDATGSVGATWIRGGRYPIGIRQGERIALSGPLIRFGRQITFENPEFEPADRPPLHTRRAVPIYPLTAGVTQLFMRTLVHDTLEALPAEPETLPDWLLEREDLPRRQAALDEIHAPTNEETLAAARNRLAFDELLPIELLVLERRRAYQAVEAPHVEVPWRLLAELRKQLPFALTGGQQRALSTILDDLASPRPMVRLLEGDVGSGKTVVAAMALLAVIAGGAQTALLAPTEILAEQHFRTLSALFGGLADAVERAIGHPIRLLLLTGALSRGDRLAARERIAAGEIDLVVGTHAVIQGDIEFANLAFAVVDEQHRFGVEQRMAIREKGTNPHLLVMTATPIPRTLALTIYGDLDVSVINEMPPGREPIETVLLMPEERERAYRQIRAEVAAGHQAFVICPLVEGSAVVEARAAVSEFERLQEHDLAGLRLALLHGRMRPAEKDAVMRTFADGQTDVLVSTPVVEVGVDVANATVMLIEGAERFGLAQLHQFRGRIGRGLLHSVCYLVCGGDSAEALTRLEALARSQNGFELAEADLAIRGPGDYFGIRQSGLPALRVANITDLGFVQRVRDAAAEILVRDPDLQEPENSLLRAGLAQLQGEVREAN
jgi:ATP-dependent DNA helicase RecG